MSNRDVVKKTRLTPEEASQLSEMADKAGKSESALLRQAILEYFDHDRAARVEEQVREVDAKLDTVLAHLDGDSSHTHMDHAVQRGSPASEKLRAMVHRIRENHKEVLKDDDVDRAIEDYAGVDDRTKRKYKRLMRRRGLLLEHPGDRPLWTYDADQWVSWLEDFGNVNGKDAVESFLDDYDATVTRADGRLGFDVSELEVARR